VACWFLAMAASVWLLARHNRVVPGAKTGAPLHWLAAPSRAASAHRRLRRAVDGARAALGGMPADIPVRGDVASCVAVLERQAVDLDHRLVVAARCPAATRWRLVNDLDPQVREVERIGARLAEVAVMVSPKPVGAGEELEILNQRLQVLSDARAELDAMEEEPRLPPEPPVGAPQLPSGEAVLPQMPVPPRAQAQQPVAPRRGQREA
jgi:hypothetical protein